MQEGSLTLEGAWQDQSVNVVVPQQVGNKGVNLVVARDVLPMGMTFDDYLSQQKKTFEKELPQFKLADDTSIIIDQRPAHFFEFSWDNRGKTIRQMMTVIHDKNFILSLTSTSPGPVEEATWELLQSVMKTFKFVTP